ncbi:TIM barrel protein [Thioclava sp. BHET1]|nr:TIM barrel protein [Thioclava sp. BHET1]
MHILSGRTEAADARAAYVAALRHALDESDLTLLIEPISAQAIPGYWLNSLDRARAVIADLASDRVKILFDSYHIAAWRKDLAAAFVDCAPLVGHVQIADPTSRAEPQIGRGAHDFAALLPLSLIPI